MFALFTQLLPWRGESHDVSRFEAMYIVPHVKENVKLAKKVHKEPVEGLLISYIFFEHKSENVRFCSIEITVFLLNERETQFKFVAFFFARIVR